jgi:hypothetical protein
MGEDAHASLDGPKVRKKYRIKSERGGLEPLTDHGSHVSKRRSVNDGKSEVDEIS